MKFFNDATIPSVLKIASVAPLKISSYIFKRENLISHAGFSNEICIFFSFFIALLSFTK